MATVPSDPVIVIPGITAVYLRDDYPLPPETIWAVLPWSKDFDRAKLHPDDLRYEAREPAQVRSGQIYEIAYRELIDELRHDLSDRGDEPVPVHPFGYDWRQPLDDTEGELDAFIDEVIARTRLLKHYHRAGWGADGNGRVNLVGHSMGGLIIAGYLERCAQERQASRVGKVATIATPFQGSYEAVIKVITGTAELGTKAPSSREREAARVTPALYHLLPDFPGAIEREAADLPASLFNPKLWQPSVVASIAEYIRLHGVEPAKRDDLAPKVFAEMLRRARRHRRRVNRLRLDEAGLSSRDWLCLVGVGAKTRIRLRVRRLRGQPEFVFRSGDREDLWSEWGKPADQRRLTGDGTVAYKGAVPRFLKPENLVCLSPDDFGYWEVEDRLTASVAGLHGILPNMNVLHRLIVRHFTGRPDKHENTWAWRAPGVVAGAWDPPLPIPRDKMNEVT